MQRENRKRRLREVAASALVLVTAFAADQGEVSAHTPHDPVTQVVLSPLYSEDRTGFAIVNGQLRRTADGFESTTLITNGLVTGSPTALGVARSAPNIVYLATMTGEVYRSDDGGLSFPIRSVAFDAVPLTRVAVAPDQPDIVVAAGPFGALVRSDDGAESWLPINDLGLVSELRASSGNAATFYVGNEDGNVYVSNDGGANWSQSVVQEPDTIASIADAPGDPSQVFIGDRSGGLQRSSNSGVDFTAVDSNGLPDSPIHDLAVQDGPDEELIIWATSDDGVYRSEDSGLTFESVSDGLTVDEEAAALGAVGFPSIAAGSTGDADVVLAGFDGLFIRDADDEQWRSTETLADQIAGLDVSPDFANDGTIAVSTYVKGAYISTDGGRTFVAANTGLGQAVDRSNTALPVRRLQNVAFSPDFSNDRRIYASTDTAMLVSNDAGASWTPVEVAAAPDDRAATNLVIGTGVSPDGTVVFAGSGTGTILRSDDGGAEGTWTTIANLNSPVRSVVVSPDFARLPEVYVTTVQGLSRSVDGGTTLTPVEADLPNAILAISPDFALDRTLFAASQTGIAVSRDGGDSWDPVEVVAVTPGIDAIAMSPNFGEDGVVLVSVRGLGLHRSTDGGVTFVPVGESLVGANLAVATSTPNPTSNPIRFATPETVFAFADSTIIVSTDAGLTWSEANIPSYQTFAPVPIPDPTDGEPEPVAPVVSEPATNPDNEPVSPVVSEPATEPVVSGSARPTIPTGDNPRRDRLIWAATAAGIALTLLVLIASGRRRRRWRRWTLGRRRRR